MGIRWSVPQDVSSLEFVCKHQAHKATNNKGPLRQDFCFTFHSQKFWRQQKFANSPVHGVHGIFFWGFSQAHSNLSRTRSAEGNVFHRMDVMPTPSLAVGNMQIVPPSVTNRSTRVDLASFGICPTRGSKDSAGLIHSECDAEVIYPQDRSPLPWWQTWCTIETSCLPEDSQRQSLSGASSLEPTNFCTSSPRWLTTYSTPLGEQNMGLASVLSTTRGPDPFSKRRILWFLKSATKISPLGEMARRQGPKSWIPDTWARRTWVAGSPRFQQTMLLPPNSEAKVSPL